MIEADAGDTMSKVVITGDFNAKRMAWGSPHTENKGMALEEFIHRNGLYIINEGDTPTSRNANESSFIDISMCGGRLLQRVLGWRVDEDEENFSPHQNIHFSVTHQPTTRRPQQLPDNTKRFRGWNVKSLGDEKTEQEISELPETVSVEDIEEVRR